MKNKWIYHLSRKKDLDASSRLNFYIPSEEDKNDGFIHFSTATQVTASARKYRNGESDIFLLEVDTNLITKNLRWEPARDGDLFPHLYGELLKEYVTQLAPLPLDGTGTHLFPELKDEPYE
ncbi:MAG: DUF952 domain-containing protein [Nisaea sp.]|nr:DUF952 domain-containing protein [Nisaea sp.]|tara:strand:- start:1063 stop:1425 length:363 start_codon:yes stop_codon:yes gene_type:complete